MNKNLCWLISTFNIEKQNLLFFSTDVLAQFIRSNQMDENRRICIAELIIRWFLNRDDNLASIIDEALPDGEREQLSKVLDENFPNLPSRQSLLGDLWNPLTPFSAKCMVNVRKRLIELCCDTDGFIPVYANGQAFFIPFHFDEGFAQIQDYNGKIIDVWQKDYCQCVGEDSRFTCVIHCNQQSLQLKGSSFMLPVLLGYWRKTGKVTYNHLRLLSTGALERNRVKAVEITEKSAGVTACFCDAYFLFPESTKYCPDKQWEISIAIGTNRDELLKKIETVIEIYGLLTPRLSDALRRLPQLVDQREDTYNTWEQLLKQVELYSKPVNSLCEPQNYLLCLMLKSSIYCHMGKTDEALRLNHEARKFAEENNFEKQLLRMEIEELVELQDKEKFREILEIHSDLGKGIEHLADDDLRMRYYGTMGQAHCCGSLAGIRGFDCRNALQCFEDAIRCASRLGSMGDIAQDLNYRYQWYVLFEPGKEDTSGAFEDAKNHIDCNLQDYPEVQTKNRHFLYRLKAFELYRCLLKTGSIPERDFEKYLLPDSAYFWLRATVCKYIGALFAASDKREKAEKLFDNAVELLSGDQIIAFIRLTVLAEAYRSLGMEKYRTGAISLAGELKHDYPASDKWLSFLTGNGDFPGLDYWY